MFQLCLFEWEAPVFVTNLFSTLKEKSHFTSHPNNLSAVVYFLVTFIDSIFLFGNFKDSYFISSFENPGNQLSCPRLKRIRKIRQSKVFLSASVLALKITTGQQSVTTHFRGFTSKNLISAVILIGQIE